MKVVGIDLMTESELERLAEQARSGDRDAAGILLGHYLPLISVMSRRVANGLIDPEDLQASAIEGLLRLWSRGEGPTTGISSYLIQSMRNRVIDEARSPRSDVRNINETEDFVLDEDLASSLDLQQASHWAAKALQRLSDEQRTVMVEIYANGRKPAEVATQLGRSPNAIYSLHRRSKIASRRAILQEVLSDGAPVACRKAADNLPDQVGDTPDLSRPVGGMKHILQCARCQKAWKRFGSISSVLGVGGFVAAVNFGAPVPASALVDASGGANLVGSGSANVADPSAPATAAAPGAAVPSSEATGQESPSEGGVSHWFHHRVPEGSAPHWCWRCVLMGAGGGVVVGGLLGVGSWWLLGPHEAPAPAGSMALVVENDENYNVDVFFSIQQPGWEQEQFLLTLPESMNLVSQPEGWDCQVLGSTVTCEDPGERPLEGRFEAEGRPVVGEEVHLEIQASADGHRFLGSASSDLPTTASVISTQADVYAG